MPTPMSAETSSRTHINLNSNFMDFLLECCQHSSGPSPQPDTLTRLCLSIHILYLAVCLTVCRSVCMFVRLSVCLSAALSVYVCVYFCNRCCSTKFICLFCSCRVKEQRSIYIRVPHGLIKALFKFFQLTFVLCLFF